MAARICVIDYKKGNLASVQRGLADAGFDAFISSDPADILAADGLVLPGVGSFADAMTTMNELGQTQAICDKVAAGAPMMGICLGMQLCMQTGDEGCEPGCSMEGLGLVAGRVERMAATTPSGDKLKVPHVGWNSVTAVQQGNPLFTGIGQDSYFYFTHSYMCVCDDEADVAGRTEHAQPFTSSICKDNLYLTQFHPEKSSTKGMRMLANFGAIVAEHAAGQKGALA